MIQLAVGSTILLLIINSKIFNRYIEFLPEEFSTRFVFFILAAALIAIISSFFHIGKPFNSLSSLNNLESSWLSREILFVLLFITFLSAYYLLEIVSLSNHQLRVILILLASILGIAVVYSMSRIYMVATIPGWNTLFTPAKFFLATAVLGITGLLLILILTGHSNLNLTGNHFLLRSILQIFLILLFAELILFIIELWTLNTGGLGKLDSFNLIVEENRFTFFLHLFVFLLSILFILFKLFYISNRNSNIALIIIAILVIVLQITERYLFYASYKRIGV